MKNIVISVTIIGTLVILGLVFFQVNIDQEREVDQIIQYDFTKRLSLQTPAFPHNGEVAIRYTCDGQNISPRFLLNNVPLNAKSLALIVDDPDVPGEPWVHWIMWNISPSVTEIIEGGIPAGAVEGITSSGERGYFGPCPPAGERHRYSFTLYALDSDLSLSVDSTKENLLRAMLGHVIEEREIIGFYARTTK